MGESMIYHLETITDLEKKIIERLRINHYRSVVVPMFPQTTFEAEYRVIDDTLKQNDEDKFQSKKDSCF